MQAVARLDDALEEAVTTPRAPSPRARNLQDWACSAAGWGGEVTPLVSRRLQVDQRVKLQNESKSLDKKLKTVRARGALPFGSPRVPPLAGWRAPARACSNAAGRTPCDGTPDLPREPTARAATGGNGGEKRWQELRHIGESAS